MNLRSEVGPRSREDDMYGLSVAEPLAAHTHTRVQSSLHMMRRKTGIEASSTQRQPCGKADMVAQYCLDANAPVDEVEMRCTVRVSRGGVKRNGRILDSRGRALRGVRDKIDDASRTAR
ncbi:uncharacterized protein MAM_05751 [Metarhizium album ARSEF 1941]|uniref:Uncharacterized protein n=1 Tax=Metarhizium album (strain ARSEF 1941) TaxID=1081103 RepID=A0A0B2WSK1_METAS|nr:uncharacterized protein MAM_05751 [Metarhizium album ARSEF 1941]KHN96462.1 hypothetical protein MAM_05751 [Metarhizium album ARSEF 1941]